MAGLETVLSIAGTVVGAVGGLVSARSESSAARYQAAIANQQATRERENAAIEARNYERRQRALLASARTRRAGSGVNIATGTSLLADTDIAKEIALGTATIRNQGAVSATRLEQQAGLYRQQARYANMGGLIRAGTTLLSGFAEAY